MTDQKTEQKPADHKAIREAARVGGDYTMAEVPDLRALLADLDEALAALTAAKAGGWVAVPVEPIAEMVRAMESQWLVGSQVDMAKREYAAMLSARPLPNPPKEQSAGGPGSVDAVANPLSPT